MLHQHLSTRDNRTPLTVPLTVVHVLCTGSRPRDNRSLPPSEKLLVSILDASRSSPQLRQSSLPPRPPAKGDAAANAVPARGSLTSELLGEKEGDDGDKRGKENVEVGVDKGIEMDLEQSEGTDDEEALGESKRKGAVASEEQESAAHAGFRSNLVHDAPSKPHAQTQLVGRTTDRSAARATYPEPGVVPWSHQARAQHLATTRKTKRGKAPSLSMTTLPAEPGSSSHIGKVKELGASFPTATASRAAENRDTDSSPRPLEVPGSLRFPT